MLIKRARSAAFGLCFRAIVIGALSVSAIAQQDSAPADDKAETAPAVPTPLSPEAQAALDKGVIAAKLDPPDYPLALRYFEEARKHAPDSPAVFFHLGLAESKMPGRELRAICWFAAYLAAEPDAPNAAAVKEQIKILDVKSESLLRQMFALAQATKPISQSAAEQLAWWWIYDGNDIAIAKQTVSFLDRRFAPADIYRALALKQADSGDFAGALITIQANLLYGDKAEALYTLCDRQALAGDFAGARVTADGMTSTYVLHTKERALQNVLFRNMYKQAKAGRIDDSLDAASKDLDSTMRNEALSWVVGQLKEDRDFVGALQTAERIQESVWKDEVLGGLVGAQAKSGDFVGALETADRISDPRSKDRRLEAIATHQWNAGDRAGARRTFERISGNRCRADFLAGTGEFFAAIDAADQIQDAKERGFAFNTIAAAQGKSGNLEDARKTFERVQDAECAEDKATSQAEAGDFAGALMTADRLEPADREYVWRAIAKAQASAGDIAGALQTAERVKNELWATETSFAIAAAQAKMGDFTGAWDTVEKCYYHFHKEPTTANVVSHMQRLAELLSSGNVNGANEISDRMQLLVEQAIAHPDGITLSQSEPSACRDLWGLVCNTNTRVAACHWIAILGDGGKPCNWSLTSAPFPDVTTHFESLRDSTNLSDDLAHACTRVWQSRQLVGSLLKRQGLVP